MKRSAIIRIIVYSLLIFLLITMLLVGIRDAGWFLFRSGSRNDTSASDTFSSGAGLHEVSYAGSEIQNISIEWAAGSIRIMPHDEDEITISESGMSGEGEAMCVTHQGRTLSVTFGKDVVFRFGVHDTDISKDLTVLVPRDWVGDNVEIAAAAAEVEVSDLEIREVEFDGASGTCVFRDCAIGTLDLDTASGDVEFSGSLKVLDCDAASADISAVIRNIPKSIDMDTMSGDLNLTLPADCGFTVTMDGLDTGLDTDFPTVMKNGNYVSGDGACRIDVDAMSGHVTVRSGGKEAVAFGE